MRARDYFYLTTRLPALPALPAALDTPKIDLAVFISRAF